MRLSMQTHECLLTLLFSRKSSSLMIINTMTRLNALLERVKDSSRTSLSRFVTGISFMPTYYRVNDLMWQDGLLIDFLQKKVADKWIRRFLVCSSYLFSERVLFKFVVRFYIDFVVWPSTTTSVFELSNIASMLMAVLLSILFLLTLFNLNYLYVVLI